MRSSTTPLTRAAAFEISIFSDPVAAFAIQAQARGEILTGERWHADADNYGELDRLYDDDMKRFKDSVCSLRAAGKTLQHWRSFIKAK